jgi:hypothetical protein
MWINDGHAPSIDDDGRIANLAIRWQISGKNGGTDANSNAPMAHAEGGPSSARFDGPDDAEEWS